MEVAARVDANRVLINKYKESEEKRVAAVDALEAERKAAERVLIAALETARVKEVTLHLRRNLSSM